MQYFKVIKELTFLIYLSIPTKNVTWQARVDICNSSKSLFKTKKHRYSTPVTPSYCILFAIFFLTSILITQINNLYNDISRKIKNIPASFCRLFLKIANLTVFLLLLIQNLLSHSDDIDNSRANFCFWNLGGVTAHSATKISLLQAYITHHNYGIIYLTETFLNSSIQSNDNRITIHRYNLIRSYYPSDSKKGVVCIYYKVHIPHIILQDDINSFDNCLVTEIHSQNEKCFLTCIYHFPSQNFWSYVLH